MDRDERESACTPAQDLRSPLADLREAIFYMHPPLDNAAAAGEVDTQSYDDQFQTCDFEMPEGKRK